MHRGVARRHPALAWTHRFARHPVASIPPRAPRCQLPLHDLVAPPLSAPFHDGDSVPLASPTPFSPIATSSLLPRNSFVQLDVWPRPDAGQHRPPRGQTPISLQQQYFPDAETCLDWYHVVEKVWQAGECMYPEGSDELAAWVGEQAKKLRRGATRAVIDEIGRVFDSVPKTGPGNKGKRERLLKIYKHFLAHQHRMKYRDLRRRDLDIGSGAVEGAVRNLVGIRLDGPGMRWSRGRSERLLHLRCILLNGQWDDFVAHLAARDVLKLPATPIPTRTHDAKAAA